MRKTIMALALLILLPGLAWAQNTAPAPTTFMILPGNPRGLDGLSGLISGITATSMRMEHLSVWAHQPDTCNAVDSVYYPQDSLDNRDGEARYIVYVDSTHRYGEPEWTTGNDTICYVRIKKIAPGIDSTVTLKVYQKRANRNVFDGLGWTFTTDVDSLDYFYVDVLYDLPIYGDDYQSLKVATIKIPESMLILEGSSVIGSADTVYSSSFSLEKKKLAVMGQATSTGTIKLGIGLQTRINGLAQWAGTITGKIILSGRAMTATSGDYWFKAIVDSSVVADSGRIAVFGDTGNTGTTEIDSLFLTRSDE